MKKIVSHTHISLDGFVSGPNGEMDWIKFDDEIFDLVKTFTDVADTALYGRVTWEMMNGYWPTAAHKPNATKHDIEHAAWYKAVDKIIISNTMKGRTLNKTNFIGDDFVSEIKKLKQKDGKNIMIFGSPSAVRSLMKENLIDEYWFFVNPVILGRGISIFQRLDQRIELIHQSTEVFSCGVTSLHYATKR